MAAVQLTFIIMYHISTYVYAWWTDQKQDTTEHQNNERKDQQILQ